MQSVDSSNHPDLSVIVATYNRAQQVQTLLVGLLEQDLMPQQYELIVVDDGSSDDTALSLKAFGQHAKERKGLHVEVLTQENAGQAAARDYGVQHAKGQYLVFLDDDMEPVHQALLRAYLQMHERLDGDHVLLGSILPPKGNPPRAAFEYWWEGHIAKLYHGFRSKAIQPNGRHFFSANISMPRQLYLDVGGFQKQFRHAEDHELGIRIQLQSDAVFAFCEDAAAYHNSPHGRFRSFKNRAELYGRYFYEIYALHDRRIELNPAQYLVSKNPLKRFLTDHLIERPWLVALFSPSLTLLAYLFAKIRLRVLAKPACALLYLLHFTKGMRSVLGATEIRTLIQQYVETPIENDPSASVDGILSTLPTERSIFYDVRMDIKQMLALFERQSSLKNTLWCIFGLDAFMILFLFRLRRLSMKYRVPFLNRLLRGWQCFRYGIEIDKNCKLGHGVTFLHSQAIVIEADVGNGVIFFGSNTIGHVGRDKPGVPVIEAGVVVGAGARILGSICIGKGANIGANAVVMSDVPAFGTTIIKPTRSVKMSAGEQSA